MIFFFKFLWNSKPDKIKRSQIAQDYSNGGLKMTNIEFYIKSLKTSWIRRAIKDNGSPWISIFKHIVGDYTKLSSLGSQWCNVLKR